MRRQARNQPWELVHKRLYFRLDELADGSLLTIGHIQTGWISRGNLFTNGCISDWMQRATNDMSKNAQHSANNACRHGECLLSACRVKQKYISVSYHSKYDFHSWMVQFLSLFTIFTFQITDMLLWMVQFFIPLPSKTLFVFWMVQHFPSVTVHSVESYFQWQISLISLPSKKKSFNLKGNESKFLTFNLEEVCFER